jgi:Tol biopolymer transport system component/predicted Ser/Thr protein kinase
MNSDEWSILDNPGPAAITPGTQIGAYRIESKLGEGGMGVVYRALDIKLNRLVAVKVLSEDLADAAARRRFQREAQMASSLNHPHILTVHDAGEIDGRQYLVTEYIDGGTLKDWANVGPHTWRDTIELLVGVADGLATAHEAGILHRDIKPANILITKSGYAKLADFGLAKLVEQRATQDGSTRTLTDELTRKGTVVGTIAYMSPEQASGRSLDARSDIFSFAVVLYQMLAGRRPFEGATDLEILQTIIHGAPQPLPDDVSAPVRAVVEKALQKDPAERYQSMREMVIGLRRLLRQTTETAAEMPATAAPAPPHSARRFTWMAAAALIVLLLAAVVGLVAFRSQQSAGLGRVQYTQLTDFADSATSPALSPDGHTLAFIRGENTFIGPGQIYVKLLPDGDPVQLTHDDLAKMRPRFSPDGARIAYGTQGGQDQGWSTWVVPVLGGQPHLLMHNAEGLSWIQESKGVGASRTPAQPRVLFSEVTGKGITMQIVSALESRSDQHTVYVQDEVMDHFSYLSPDQKQLLLAEMGFNGWQPCRVAPFDGNSKGKTVGPQPAQCTGAAWSPDGKWMYFSANTGSGFHIWRQHFPDGAPEQVTSGTSEEEGVEFAADGRSFLTSIGTLQSTLWIHDSRGDRQVTSEGYTSLPTFSADGKKLYYLARAGEEAGILRGGLWTTDLDSGDRNRLLPDYLMEHYSISSDGQRVVFVSASGTGRSGVWLADLDGRSAPRQLTTSAGLQVFFGAPGDVFFAAQEQDGTFVYQVKEDGTDLRKVIPHSVYFLYSVAPDGKHLAVWATGSTPQTPNAVLVYPVEGGSAQLICGTCAGRGSLIHWSPDGRLFYFNSFQRPTLAVPLRTGQILPPLPAIGIQSDQDLAALPGAKPYPMTDVVPGPDPSTYAYPKTSTHRNIYRVSVP